MTLRQIGVDAMALAVFTPIGRSASSFWSFATLAAVELPFALLIPLLVLIRRGPVKDWVFSAVCAVPQAALLVTANFAAARLCLDGVSPPALLVVAIVDALILAGLVYLGRRLIPRRCPACGQPALLRDPSVPRFRDFPGSRLARSCLACGSRFRRTRPGPWVDVDLLPARSTSPPLVPKLTFQDDRR